MRSSATVPTAARGWCSAPVSATPSTSATPSGVAALPARRSSARPRPAERDRVIAAFKRGDIRCLTNANVLTTGFNAPGVDLIAMLRPTKSVGLYVQMIGRGTRLANGKDNCLVLDFAGNVERHGPIDRIDGRKRKKDDEEGAAPVKTCPDCQTIVHASTRLCPTCGYRVPAAEAGSVAHGQAPAPSCRARSAPSGSRSPASPTIATRSPAARPACASSTPAAWPAIASGSASSIPATPGRRRCSGGRSALPDRPVPRTIDEALALCDQLPKPARINVRPQGRYTEIIGSRVRPMLCDVCRREARGFGWFDPVLPLGHPRQRLRQLLLHGLPGHLPSEAGHDRSDAEREGGVRPRRRDGRRVSRQHRQDRSGDVWTARSG